MAMKLLNEQNLIYFSKCPSPALKEGWLNKRGEVNKGFQKRWFILKGNLLFYFERPADKEPLGVIILEGYTVELTDDNNDGFTFQISFRMAGNSRKFILQAESQQTMEEWMKALTCAGYDYMKLMVAELKAQLDELISQELALELSECKGGTSQVSTNRQNPSQRSISPNPAIVDSIHDQHKSHASVVMGRHNPFDQDSFSTSLDAFGQVPFSAAVAGCTNDSSHSRESSQLNVPHTKKKISSPLLFKKNRPLEKSTFHTVSSSTSVKCGHSEKPDSSSLSEFGPSRTFSRFSDLHQFYGEAIRAAISRISQVKLIDIQP